MSDYVKATNFAVKDGLTTGDPSKRIKGTEIDTEYTAIASAISSKADTNSPTFTGTPLAPTASGGTSTTQIATTAFVATAVAAAVAAAMPSGSIVMWSGSIASIPSGWYLCNGSNGTPDLRDKFIVGAGNTYSVAGTGGSKDAIIVSHTHTATSTVTDPGHTHNVLNTRAGSPNGGGSYVAGATANPGTNDATSSNTTGVTVATSIASTGSSGTNANLPPYYALAFIMKS